MCSAGRHAKKSCAAQLFFCVSSSCHASYLVLQTRSGVHFEDIETQIRYLRRHARREFLHERVPEAMGRVGGYQQNTIKFWPLCETRCQRGRGRGLADAALPTHKHETEVEVADELFHGFGFAAHSPGRSWKDHEVSLTLLEGAGTGRTRGLEGPRVVVAITCFVITCRSVGAVSWQAQD